MINSANRSQSGFTLAELAIAVVVIALLMTGGLVSLAAQQDLHNVAATKRIIGETREALLGYAAAYERLPCPATGSSNGIEAHDGTGICTASPGSGEIGYVPAATLSLGPTDSAGFLIDAWGNRIGYTVTASDDSAFTKAGGMRTTGVADLDPNLEVCSAAGCATYLTKQTVAVIYSLGKNGGAPPTTADEQENTDSDKTFVSASNSSFDDVVIWLSPYTLYNRMIAAGAL